jgi:hypothetical protein
MTRRAVRVPVLSNTGRGFDRGKTGGMRRKKYPLESLAHLKKDRVDAKARELGAAVSAREAREAERVRKEAEREAARASADVIRTAERAALERGDLRAIDLSRVKVWDRRVQLEDLGRAREVDEARTAEDRSRAAEGAAKNDVATARAESESVEQHRKRWKAALRKGQESLEEEAVADAVRPKRGR